jgi:hypothetical protein
MGLSFNDMFPSRFFKADDLAQPLVVKIREVTLEQLGNESSETKPVLYFVNQDKALCLNKTNATAIINITGSENTDDWIGQRIELFKDTVMFRGQRTPAVRVRAPHRATAPASAVTDEDGAEADDSIPDPGEPVRRPNLKLGKTKKGEVGE